MSLDLVTREVTSAGSVVELQPREFSLLAFLQRHAGHPVSKTKTLEQVCRITGFDPQLNVDATSRSHRLRSKIDPDHVRIETLRGVGYVFRPHAGRSFRQSLAIPSCRDVYSVGCSRQGAATAEDPHHWVLAQSLEARGAGRRLSFALTQ